MIHLFKADHGNHIKCNGFKKNTNLISDNSVTEANEVYDKIEISQNKTTNNIDFSRQLSKEITLSLKSKKADSKKVMEIKQAISTNTYKIDTKRIAEKILGYR